MHSLQGSYRIETAIDALKSMVDLDVQLDINANEFNRDNSKKLTPNNSLIINNHSFLIKLKKDFRLNQIPDLISDKKNNIPFILIADAISDNVKTVLREHKINYLDASGNAFIQDYTGLSVFINGQKTVLKSEINKDKAFTNRGLVVVFHFLIDENLINSTYRNICEKTETSLATVTNVIQSLRQQGFIIQVNDKTKRLTDKKRLFEKWADAYETRLKPKLFLGKFRFKDNDAQNNWKNISLSNHSAWGGEPAADLLTNFLRPEIFTLYSTETRKELITNYKFLPDPNGVIEVYKPFSKISESNKIAPLLVYADLLNTGDSRNYETAQKIKEQYEKEFF
jgi:hypothetical protein